MQFEFTIFTLHEPKPAVKHAPGGPGGGRLASNSWFDANRFTTFGVDTRSLWVELKPERPSYLVLRGTYGEKVHEAFRMFEAGAAGRDARIRFLKAQVKILRGKLGGPSMLTETTDSPTVAHNPFR